MQNKTTTNTHETSRLISALVLDGTQRSALAATRSLGSKNITVHTASEAGKYLCAHSKYSSQHATYPDPSESPKAFLSWIKSYVIENNIGIIFPMTEVTCRILAPHLPRIGDAIIPLASMELLEYVSNKNKLVELAQRLDIPVPQSIIIHSKTELDQQFALIKYPCVVKPALSKYYDNGRWHSTAVKIVTSEAELLALLDNTPYLHTQAFMIQQYIDGEGQGIFTCYTHGKDLAWFAHRRIREKPPWGGVSVLSESIAAPKNMVALSKKLLDEVGWHGVAMIEYKVASDGTPYLMEINTRFWGSLQLSIDSGIDFPYLLYCAHCSTSSSQTHSTDYKTRQRLRWFLGDLDSLLISFRHQKQLSPKSKIKALYVFLTCCLSTAKNEVLRWQDIKPGLFEIRQYIKSLYQ